MEVLPSYYDQSTQESVYENENILILDDEVCSISPPPSYKSENEEIIVSQTSLLYVSHTTALDISMPVLISGPSHLATISKKIIFDRLKKPLPALPHFKESVLSENIRSYLRSVDVFSSIAKENMYCVSIIHVKKKENNSWLKAWLNPTFQLKTLEVTHNMIVPGVFFANDCLTRTDKAVLHLAATSIYSQIENTVRDLNPFGFTFFWNKSNEKVLSKEQKEYDISHLALVPDEQIQAALSFWFKQQQVPCLSVATEIYRHGVEIYVVFERYYF